MKILHSIKELLKQFAASTAHAIDTRDWRVLLFNLAVALLTVLGTLLLCSLFLFLLWKIVALFLGKFLLKLLGIPLVLYILYLSYKADRADTKNTAQQHASMNGLEVWSEEIYGYVRDAMFLVFRSVSEYTAIVMPSAPSAIELPNGISVKDGYAVFHFFARLREPIDAAQVKRDLTKTLNQLARAHELKGIPSDLVQINGAYYAPLQIFDVVDCGNSIDVSVVFADEKTINIVKARKVLRLELNRSQQPKPKEALFDDVL